jgi:hypothetical protein
VSIDIDTFAIAKLELKPGQALVVKLRGLNAHTAHDREQAEIWKSQLEDTCKRSFGFPIRILVFDMDDVDLAVIDATAAKPLRTEVFKVGDAEHHVTYYQEPSTSAKPAPGIDDVKAGFKLYEIAKAASYRECTPTMLAERLRILAKRTGGACGADTALCLVAADELDLLASAAKPAPGIDEVHGLTPGDQRGWCIQLDDSGSPHYRGKLIDGRLGWTTDAKRAVYFARKQDAELVIECEGSTKAFAAEYVWVSGS